MPCHAFTIPGQHFLLCPIRTNAFFFLLELFRWLHASRCFHHWTMARGRKFVSLSLFRFFHVLIGTLSFSFLQTDKRQKHCCLRQHTEEKTVHIQPHVRRRLASFSAGRVSKVSSRRPCCLSASLSLFFSAVALLTHTTTLPSFLFLSFYWL